MTNLPEGYMQKSLKGLIKLAGVERGSLEELLKDYLSFARQHKLPIWLKEKANRTKIHHRGWFFRKPSQKAVGEKILSSVLIKKTKISGLSAV